MQSEHEITLTDEMCELRWELPLYNFEVRFIQYIIDHQRQEAEAHNAK
jgi:hypothetical protein